LGATGRAESYRSGMGIFRYIVQGAGWELGRTAAREGIEALEQTADEEPVPDRELEQQRLRAAALARKQRERAEAERRARIEAELAELKRRR